MADIRINDLDPVVSPTPNLNMAADGATMGRMTIEEVVETGRPVASQAEAEAGTNPTKAMTPLTTAQAITVQAATAAEGALAASAVQPSDLAQVATSGDYNDLLNQPSLSADLIYPTRADAIAATVPGSEHALKLNGDATEGDGFGGLFIDTNNGSPDTFMSGDGRTWYRAKDVSELRLVDALSAKVALAVSSLQPSDIGVDVQAHSANLDELATVNPGATGLAVLATATPADAADIIQPFTANTMLVDNPAGTDRESKTFEQVKTLLGLSPILGSYAVQGPDYDAGTQDSVRTLLSNADGKHKHFADIARDYRGRIYIAYRFADTHGLDATAQIKLLRIDNNGYGPTVSTTVIPAATGRDARAVAISILPNGRICLLWTDAAVTLASDPTYFKRTYSDDRGDTWATAATIDTMPATFSGRIFGGMSVVPSPDDTREYELIAPYYLTRSPSTTYERGYYISTDGDTWVKETAEGYPVVTTTALQNEMAMDAVNRTVWFAVIRDDAVNQPKIAYSLDGRASWSSFTTVAAGSNSLEEGPALKIVKDSRGIPYVLLALTNRANKTVRWTWAKVRDVVLLGGAAFVEYVETGVSGNAYPMICDFDGGQLLYVYANEPLGEPSPDPTSLMLGSLDYGELVSGGRRLAFTPVFKGGTTPGTPTGTFSGWYAREGDRYYGQIRATFTGLGGMVGAVQIDTGLPVAGTPGLEWRGGAHVNFRSAMTNDFVMAGYIIQNTSTIALVNAAADATNVLATDMSATTSLFIDFSYFKA